jgi:peptide/nickel transport system ATP-binding protein/oligopeptide transport system ATP-binding protein
MSENLLVAKGLVKHFPVRGGWLGRRVGAVQAVDGVDVTVAAGETLAIVGESGCGKSTLGRLLLRLIEPDAGSISFNGQDFMALDDAQLRAQRRHAQLVFQDPFASLNPRLTVGQAVGEPLRLHNLCPPDQVRARVAALLAQVGLRPEHAERYPHEFSGGQRQRIGIARALAGEPRLIVGDEPVSALDVSVQAQVLNLLSDLLDAARAGGEGLAFVLIAHDLGVVRHIADRVAVMYLGRIVEIGPTAEVFAAPRHPYTRALLAAIPRPDPSLQRQAAPIAGDVPSPIAPPPGCRFHTRCAHAQDRCRTDDPALRGDPHQAGPHQAGPHQAGPHQAGPHQAACHFSETLPRFAAVEAVPDLAATARLARLAARFVRAPRPAPTA